MEEEVEVEVECNVMPGKPSLGHKRYCSEGRTNTCIDNLDKCVNNFLPQLT
jgi:hypothetical protein